MLGTEFYVPNEAKCKVTTAKIRSMACAIGSLSHREKWKYSVHAPCQLISLCICPPIPVNKLKSEKTLGES